MIYFVRHGECEANKLGRLAGQSDDSPLTQAGREQAVKAAEDLKSVQIGAIISSPLVRAWDTAQIIAKQIGFDPARIVSDPRILEREMGEMSGRLIAEVPNNDWADVPGVELAEDMQARILDFLREHKNDAGNVLIVSHSGVGKIIEATRTGVPVRQFHTVQTYPNGHVVQLDLDWLH